MQASLKLHSAAQLFSRSNGIATPGDDCLTQPQPQARLPAQLTSHCAVVLQLADPPGPPPPHTAPR